MTDGMAGEVRHPIDQIRDWIDEQPSGELSVVDLYTQGPERLDMAEIDIRLWVNEGMDCRVFTLGGLTSVMRVRSDAPPDVQYPSEPRQHVGY